MQTPRRPPAARASRRPQTALVAGVALGVCAGPWPGASAPETGRIAGVVRITDDLPPNPLASMALPPPSVTRNDPETLNVVVYVETAPRATRLATATTELAQVEEEFRPHVLPVAAGTSVAFPNGDPLFHNVFSVTPHASFNLGQYPKGQARTFRFLEAGIVKVHCKIHSFMSAVVFVFDHRAFTQPDRDGSFTLDGVAAGHHRLVVWHERGGALVREIDVKAGAETRISVAYPGPGGTAP